MSNPDKELNNDFLQITGMILAASLLFFLCVIAMSVGDYFDYLKTIDSNVHELSFKNYQVETYRQEIERLKTSCKG